MPEVGLNTAGSGRHLKRYWYPGLEVPHLFEGRTFFKFKTGPYLRQLFYAYPLAESIQHEMNLQ